MPSGPTRRLSDCSSFGLRRLAGRPVLVVLVWRTPHDHPALRAASQAARAGGVDLGLGRLDEDAVGDLVRSVSSERRRPLGGPPLLDDHRGRPVDAGRVPAGRRRRRPDAGRGARGPAGPVGPRRRDCPAGPVGRRGARAQLRRRHRACGERPFRRGDRGVPRGAGAPRPGARASRPTTTSTTSCSAPWRTSRPASPGGGSCTAGRPPWCRPWPRRRRHHELAGRDDAAADAHRAAGEQARAVFANAEALGHLRRALELGHPDRSGLLTRAVRRAGGAGRLRRCPGEPARRRSRGVARTTWPGSSSGWGGCTSGAASTRSPGPTSRRRGAALPEADLAGRASVTADLALAVHSRG